MQNKFKVLSIISIILGACAIGFCVLELTVLGLICGIAGIGLSIVLRKQAAATGESKVMATIGLVLSVIGAVACVVAIILYFVNEAQKEAAFPGVIDAEV